MKAIVIGIMPWEQNRDYILAVAGGSRPREPHRPKVWFASMKSLRDTLSNQRLALRREVIKKMRPASMAELAEIAGSDPVTLARAMTTVSDFGVMELKRESDQVQLVAVTTGMDLAAQ